MPQKLYVVQNDLSPVPSSTLVDQQSLNVDLQGCAVFFRLIDARSGYCKINNANAQILQSGPSSTGQVLYNWQQGDTDTPGLYSAYWIVSAVSFINLNQQTINIVGNPNAGTFQVTMNVNGVTQYSLVVPFDIDVTDLATALANMSFISSTSNISVTGTPGVQYVITFIADLAQVIVPTLMVTASFSGGLNPGATVFNTSSYQTTGQQSFPNDDTFYILVNPKDQTLGLPGPQSSLPAQPIPTFTVNAFNPLTGGGTLGFGGTIGIGVSNSGVTPGSYTNTNLTVNEYGLIISAENGTGGGGGGGSALNPTVVMDSNYTASPSDYVVCNPSAGSFTVHLPNAPADQTVVGAKIVVAPGVNTVTIQTSGSDVFNVSGGATTLTLQVIDQGVIAQYQTSTKIWYVTNDDLPVGQLDLRYEKLNTLVTPSLGGTGVANNALSTISISGAYGLTLSLAGTTSLTLPTSGTLAILASPAFSGVPTAPTATFSTNTTQLATTAFVQTAASTAQSNAEAASQPLNSTLTSISSVGTTGTGAVVLASSPTLVTPILGTPQSGTLTNCTFPTLNQNTTGTASNLSGTPALPNGTTATTQATTDDSTKIATTAFVAAAFSAGVQGLSPKAACQAATTTTLPSNTYNNGSSGVGATLTGTSTGAITIDGYIPNPGDRILVKNEVAGANNGIYTTTTNTSGSDYVLTRATDSNTGALIEFEFTFIQNGTVNAGSGWVNTNSGTITIGTTAITYSQFSSAGSYTAGSGLTLTGTVFSIGSGQVTNAMLAGSIAASKLVGTDIATVGTITTGTWQGTAISNTYLANSSITVNGTSISLGGSGTVAAAAGTLTGNTLNSTVVNSSLSAVGTIVTGNWQGTTVAVGYGGTGVTSVTTSPTATSFAGWDANSNLSANNHIDGYTSTLTAAATTTLTVSSTRFQYFTGTTTQTVKLPVAATLVVGQEFRIVNLSTGGVTVESSGSNTVQTQASNTEARYTCILASGTTAASWSVEYLPLVSGVTGSGSIVLNTSPALVTPVLGTPSSGNLANCTFPTLNQNTTGTAANVTGTVVVANGGTGLTTITAHSVLIGEGTSNVSFATTGTAGQLLIDQGSGNDPAFEPMSGDATIASAGVITVGSIGGKAVSLSGSFSTSGAHTLTLTTTANTNVTLPTSGTLVNSAVTTLSSLVSIGTIGTGVWQGTTVAVGYGGTGVTSVTTTPTATSFAGWDANENLSANNHIEGYASTATAGTTTTLTVASAYQQYFTGSSSQTVVLPVASTLAEGMQFEVVNISSGTVTVQSSGGNTIQAQAANSSGVYTCVLNSGTTAASWSVSYTLLGGSGAGTVTSVGLSTNSSFLTVGSSPVTTSGTITLNLATGLTQNQFLATPNGSSGTVSLRSIVAADVPTLNQNTTGTAANVTGTVGVANGGTGLTTLTAHSVLLGEGTVNVAFAITGTSGQLLIDQGSGSDPSFNAMSGDATITNAGVITVASIGGESVSLAGNFTTSGAHALTLTTTGSTNVTLPTSGTLVNASVATLSSLTSVGTIGTGTWQGTVVGSTYGGTGVNNGSSTITIGGSVIFSGAYTFTGTLTNTTSVTFPTSGTLVNTSVTVLSSLATVGTIGIGTWQGTLIGSTYGGTGVNNGSSTITIGGNVTFSGAHTFTGTLTGTTAVTFPTSGTLATTTNANVASVSNTDSSLTISPTTGAVVASLNVANPNAWQAIQTFNAGTAIQGDNSATVNQVALTSNVATLTTSASHGFSVDQWVMVQALANTQFNTSSPVPITAVTTNTFSYALTGSNVSPTADAGIANTCVEIWLTASTTPKLWMISGEIYGGVNLSSPLINGQPISLAGSFTTSGANTLTLTTSGNTNVTLPTSGTLVNTAVTTLSSLVSIGTITTGTWTATTIAIAHGGTGVMSVTTAPTATAFAGWDANENLSANNMIDGYATTVTSGATVTLTVSSSAQQNFTGSTAQLVSLPATSTLVLGQQFILNNLSTALVTVQSSGSNTVQIMQPNTMAVFQVVSTSVNTAAAWNATLMPNNAYYNPRVTLITSSATPTPNCNTTDTYRITDLAAGATFGAITGTPYDGQRLEIEIMDNGTPQALNLTTNLATWGSTVAAPTTTVAGKWLYVQLKYNATAGAWLGLATNEF